MRKLATAIENPELFKMKATCNGKGWSQYENVPCYQLWEVTALDIEKRYDDGDVYYGFVCPECGCFTQLCEKDIPLEVRYGAKLYYERGKED